VKTVTACAGGTFKKRYSNEAGFANKGGTTEEFFRPLTLAEFFIYTKEKGE
jgi:hypothetical protein